MDELFYVFSYPSFESDEETPQGWFEDKGGAEFRCGELMEGWPAFAPGHVEIRNGLGEVVKGWFREAGDTAWKAI